MDIVYNAYNVVNVYMLLHII